MALTATATADKTSGAPGDKITVSTTVSGLDPGVPEKDEDLGAATLSGTTTNGQTYSGATQHLHRITPATPGETVTDESMVFDGKPVPRNPDGTFTVTL